ncbi:MAG TPA: hypothetical protein VG389_27825 [Myxococcota bacterium]|nr:hypothetical protein [Myxococcota bacterium]
MRLVGPAHPLPPDSFDVDHLGQLRGGLNRREEALRVVASLNPVDDEATEYYPSRNVDLASTLLPSGDRFRRHPDLRREIGGPQAERLAHESERFSRGDAGTCQALGDDQLEALQLRRVNECEAAATASGRPQVAGESPIPDSDLVRRIASLQEASWRLAVAASFHGTPFLRSP